MKYRCERIKISTLAVRRAVRVLLLVGVAVALAIPVSVAGQSLLGRVVAEDTGRPIAGAFVSLQDSTDRVVRAVISSENGSFRLGVPVSGIYRVRVERIGFDTWISGEVELSVRGSQSLELRVPVKPVELSGLRVDIESRCVGRPDELPAAEKVWREVRKGLKRVVWTEGIRAYQFTIANWVRLRDSKTLQILDSDIRIEAAQTEYRQSFVPYGSEAPETLSRLGYVQQAGDRYLYFGPDAQALTSDYFLRDHCFRIVYPTGSEPPEWIGLGFEPAEGKTVPDVEGVLWLDVRTAELKEMVFRHARLPGRVNDDTLGGRLVFERLPTGAWIVAEWVMLVPDMPISAGEFAEAGHLTLGKDNYDIVEAGGRVVGLSPGPTGEVGMGQLPSIEGRVEQMSDDSTRGVAGARVQLADTPYYATTDSSGGFTFVSALPGEYRLILRSPDLQVLGLDRPGRGVALKEGPPGRVALKLPPEMDLISATECSNTYDEGRRSGQREKGVAVAGRILSAADESPIRGASVRLLQDERIASPEAVSETISGEGGRYVLCAPRTGRFKVVVAGPSLQAERCQVSVLRDGTVVFKNIEVRSRHLISTGEPEETLRGVLRSVMGECNGRPAHGQVPHPRTKVQDQ